MSKTRRIDAHMHIAQWYLPDGTTAFDVLRQYRKDNGIDAVDNMCCSNQNNLWGGYEADQNIIAAIMKLEVPSSYIHGAMFIPDIPAEQPIPREFDFVSQAEELRAIGFDGFKVCEYKPDSYKLHHMESRAEEFERYFDYCEREDIPMCFHVADPEYFWDKSKLPEWVVKRGWCYDDPSFARFDDLISDTLGILDRHPKLRVMLAHAFFHSHYPERVRALFEKYPNITLDLAPGWEMFEGFRENYDDWYEIFRTYSNRILFATDATLTSGIGYISQIAERVGRFLETDETFETGGNHIAHGIALDGEALENLNFRNAERIVGAEPRPLDRQLLGAYIKRYLPLLPETRNKRAIEEYYRKNF